MRIALGFAAALFALSLAAPAMACDCDKKGNKDLFAKGVTLVYQVDFRGEQYQFIVTIGDKAPDLKFAWAMTEPVGGKGDVIIREKALKEATTQMNYFGDGAHDDLTNSTSVWVSKAVWTALKGSKPIDIDTGGGAETLTYKAGEKYKVKVGDKEIELPVLYGETSQNSKFWILDDENEPIILKMDLIWKIWLVEIKK